MVTYHYRPPRIAQAQGQPENVLTWLRSLRRYLEVKEGARIIGCHRETFYGLIAAGCPAETRHGRMITKVMSESTVQPARPGADVFIVMRPMPNAGRPDGRFTERLPGRRLFASDRT